MSKPILKRTFVAQQASLSASHWIKRASIGIGIAASLALFPVHAHALTLGVLKTLSHMGERLNAEIDIPEVAASELQGMTATIATPDMFQASGVEFNPGLVGANVSLQKSSEGRYFLKVSTPNAINDPFVNLVLVVNWSSGRIVRDYSVLLNPPDASKLPATVVTSPTIASNASPSNQVAQSTASRSAAPVSESAEEGSSQKKIPKTRGSASKEPLTVGTGMTASEIALANKPAGISLDQMLVALLKANPQAFIEGNVNRIKAGAVLNLPGNQEITQIAKTDAQQLIAAQSQDFEQYKRKLAGLAPEGDSNVAKLQATGRVEAKVTEKKAVSAAPDKLQLSTATKGGNAKETAIANDLQSKEDATRLATLSKNIKDLNQLGNTVGTGAVPSASASVNSPKSVLPEIEANTATQAASNAGSTSANVAKSASAPLATNKETNLFGEISGHPMFVPAGVALIAILGGWAWFRQRQRKAEDLGDAAFFESSVHEDTFPRTNDRHDRQPIDPQYSPEISGSGPNTPNQLNAPTHVDPIAEAEVYLSYGRDMQAEEILKDAMLAHPSRLAIPLKLLEIYAKRADGKSFDKLASQVKSLTNGQGPEWEYVRELAKPLSSVTTIGVDTIAALGSADVLKVKGTGPAPMGSGASSASGEASKPVSYKMDLDASTGVSKPPRIEQRGRSHSPSTSTTRKSMSGAAPNTSSVESLSGGRSTSLMGTGSPDIIDFDLSALSLDLNSAVPTAGSTPPQSTLSDPWATKLALAKEFQSIGDLDSARKMVHEVIIGAGESVRTEAKKVLAGMT